MDASITLKLNTFFSQFKFQKYKKGEIFIRADSEPLGILYLTKGMVKQYSISPEGVEQALTIYKPQTFFPMMWAINNLPNSYYYEAVGDVEVWCAPKDEVISFIKTEPDVLYDLLGRLYVGMSGLLTRIEYLMNGSAYHRVVFTILNIAERFGEKEINSNDTTLHTTHKEIAAFSGLTKETISRQSRILQDKGLIENKNHTIHVKNMQKLENELLHYSSH